MSSTAFNAGRVTSVTCSSTGTCPACTATGESGFFLTPPSQFTRPCWHCEGTGQCETCRGLGSIAIPEFRPYISVLASPAVPSQILIAAFTGAFWRYLYLPRWVLRRTARAQRDWVSWRVRRHFIEQKGECRLFGEITGHAWHRGPDESIRFDIHGKVTVTRRRSFSPPSGSLTIANKELQVRDETGPYPSMRYTTDLDNSGCIAPFKAFGSTLIRPVPTAENHLRVHEEERTDV